MEKDRTETKLEQSQSELGKTKAELDKIHNDVGRNYGDSEALRARCSKLEMDLERLRVNIF